MASNVGRHTWSQRRLTGPIRIECRWRRLCATLLICVAAAGEAYQRDELSFQRESLRGYRVDIGQSSVSGLSAGAYMADQFFVAHSSDVRGAAVFAGGPYNCARGNVLNAVNACMSVPLLLTRGVVRDLLDTARARAAAGQIDDLGHLAERRLYLFSGTRDRTVRQGVTDRVEDWYLLAGMPAANIRYEDDVRAGHALPTLDYGNDCDEVSAPPWLSDCDLDAAGEALQHIYGPLRPPTPVTATTGIFIEFPQHEFFDPPGLGKQALAERFSFNEFGYAYVPAGCAAGRPCRVHIVFHGCKQVYDSNPDSDAAGDSSDPFGLQMVLHAGFNEWAHKNDLIVLYPQVQRVDATEYIPGFGNPRGCFDWWGYIRGTGSTYATKAGPQIAAVRAMLERLATGAGGDNGLPRIEIRAAVQCGRQLCLDGRVTDPDPDDAITSLRVAFTDAAQRVLIAETEFVDALAADGEFSYRVRWPRDDSRYVPVLVAEDGRNGVTTVRGGPITVGAACRKWTASNFGHLTAGRAYAPWLWFGFNLFAAGSDDALGPGWAISTLHEDSGARGVFRVGDCPN